LASFTIRAAKTHLAKLIARAEAGEEIVLVRGDKPIAKIVPMTPTPKRKFGRLKGKGSIGPEVFEPLPEDELKLWE
jgi:prevent-host-death family protein